MKLTIDRKEKTISFDDNYQMKEIIKELKAIFQNDEWREYELLTNYPVLTYYPTYPVFPCPTTDPYYIEEPIVTCDTYTLISN